MSLAPPGRTHARSHRIGTHTRRSSRLGYPRLTLAALPACLPACLYACLASGRSSPHRWCQQGRSHQGQWRARGEAIGRREAGDLLHERDREKISAPTPALSLAGCLGVRVALIHASIRSCSAREGCRIAKGGRESGSVGAPVEVRAARKGAESGWQGGKNGVAGVQICRPAELFEQALENEIVPRIPTLRTAYSAAGAWTPCLGTHARKVDSRRETLTS